MTNANSPNLEFVENVEMTNANNNAAKKVAENAKKAENNARQAAVNRSKAEAVAERAAARAKREESTRNNAAAKKAAENAKKAAEKAKKAAENAEKAKKAAENAEKAKKAAENAEKAKKAAAANTNKAAENAEKLAANAIVKNVDNKLEEILKKTNLSKTEKNKEGTKVYRKATMKVHPQRMKISKDDKSFKKLGKIYNNFQTKIGTKVRVEQELSNENRPR